MLAAFRHDAIKLGEAVVKLHEPPGSPSRATRVDRDEGVVTLGRDALAMDC